MLLGFSDRVKLKEGIAEVAQVFYDGGELSGHKSETTATTEMAQRVKDLRGKFPNGSLDAFLNPTDALITVANEGRRALQRSRSSFPYIFSHCGYREQSEREA